MPSMKYLLCYGTLRKDAPINYNYERYGEQKLIEKLWVFGYRLVSLGAYPAAVKMNGNIHCELHEVDEETFDIIAHMERSFGYVMEQHEVETAAQGRVIAYLFRMPLQVLAKFKGLKSIDSGDWADIVPEKPQEPDYGSGV